MFHLALSRGKKRAEPSPNIIALQHSTSLLTLHERNVFRFTYIKRLKDWFQVNKYVSRLRWNEPSRGESRQYFTSSESTCAQWYDRCSEIKVSNNWRRLLGQFISSRLQPWCPLSSESFLLGNSIPIVQSFLDNQLTCLPIPTKIYSRNYLGEPTSSAFYWQMINNQS
jgi:hypothetical protein